VGLAGVESRAIVLVERQPELNALRQVRIRDVVTPERNKIGISLFDDGLGAVWLESTCRDDPPFKILRSCAAATGCNPSSMSMLPLIARLDDVEVGQSEPVQLVRYVAEQSCRIAVRHPVPRSARSNAHRDAIATPTPITSPPPVLAGNGIGSRSIRRMHQFVCCCHPAGTDRADTHCRHGFDAVKARGFRALGGPSILLDYTGNFYDVQCPMW